MKIIVCCKVVPEEQDIIIKQDCSVDLTKAVAKISQYDLNAIECAMQLAGAGDEVIALTAGSPKWVEGTKIRKDILSRGPAKLEVVQDMALTTALPDTTAHVLAAAVKKIGFDLVICGEGSGDLYAQQVGLLLGEDLGVPSINAVSKVKVEGGKLLLERDLERETEVLEMPLPAVICVTSDINVPKVPTMKAILGAGKKPVNVTDCAALGVNTDSLSSIVSIIAPSTPDRLQQVLENDSDENLAAFADMVRKALKG